MQILLGMNDQANLASILRAPSGTGGDLVAG